MKTSMKLAIGFGCVDTLIWVAFLLTANISLDVQKQFRTLQEDTVPAVLRVSEIETEAGVASRAAKDYIITGNTGSKDAASAALDRLSNLDAQQIDYASFQSAEDLQGARELMRKADTFTLAIADYIHQKDWRADMTTLVDIENQKVNPALYDVLGTVQIQRAILMEELSQAEAASRTKEALGMRLILSFALLSVLLAVAVTFFITRSIVKPLHALHRGTEIIGKGNLDYKVGTNARDEIGQLSRAFDKMTQDMKTTMTSIDTLNKEIAERKREQAQLQESEEKYRALFEQAVDSIALIDLETGEILDFNDRAHENLGYTREEFAKLNLTDIDASDGSENVKKGRNITREKGSNIFETKHRTKSGEIRDVYVSSNIVSIGEKPVVLNIWHDITEHKRAEEKLRESEEKLRTLFEILPVGVSILDAERNVVYTNPALERILDISKAGLLKGDYKSRAYLKPDGTLMLAEEYASARAIKKQGAVHNVETGVLKEDGNVIWTNVSAVPVTFPDWKVVIVTSDITERKRAEEALRESEEKLAKAFRSTPELVAIATLDDSRYLEINDTFTRVTGYTREEVIGHTAFELGLWASPQLLAEMVQTLKKNKRVHNLEFEFYTKSGGIRTGLLSSEVIELGGETCRISIVTDITERKQADNELRMSEQNFRNSLDTSPMGVRIVNSEGELLYTNQAFLDICGYGSIEELKAVPRNQLYTPESYAEHEKRKGMRKRGELVPPSYEMSIVRPDGEVRHLQVFRKETIWNGQKQFQALYQDITERKRAEEALRESEERWYAIFNQAPSGIGIATPDGKVLGANEAMLTMMGYSPKELKNINLADTYENPEDRKRLLDILRQQGRVTNFTTHLKRKDGTIYDALLNLTRTHYRGESILQTTCMDITERKQAEAQAREADTLRELDRLRTQLLANISHELRTPLASIKGFATVLLSYDKKLKRDEKREYLETIDKSADRLTELIQQLLDMARLESGAMPLEKKPTGLGKLLRDAVAEAQVRSPTHHFSLELARRLPKTNIDARRIRQVLDNLISNAVNYSQAETEVTVAARRVNNEILVSVADQGIGIPPGELPHVFDRLFRGQQSRLQRKDGIGLGLPICRALVDAHGGRIWIESEEGKGTKCFFTLPLHITKSASDVPPARGQRRLTEEDGP